MRKFILAAVLVVAVPTFADAGERCRPVRSAVAGIAERWKARTVRVARFACEVAAIVRPVVTVGFERSRPVLSLTLGGDCANGRCNAK